MLHIEYKLGIFYVYLPINMYHIQLQIIYILHYFVHFKVKICKSTQNPLKKVYITLFALKKRNS